MHQWRAVGSARCVSQVGRAGFFGEVAGRENRQRAIANANQARDTRHFIRNSHPALRSIIALLTAAALLCAVRAQTAPTPASGPTPTKSSIPYVENAAPRQVLDIYA